MKIPPYFKQEKPSTCSLAVLRMVLGHFNLNVTELELEQQVINDYGQNFSNIWNPTIAKLACEYGLDTTLYADWPLLKKDVIQHAFEEFKKNPMEFDVRKYENSNDADTLPEPLPLSYKEMFLALEKGCKAEYGQLCESNITDLLSSDFLIQTSIKLHLMYPESKKDFHSILLYGLDEDIVFYHDPYYGAALSCKVEHLLKSTMDVGAFMAYQKS